MRLTCVSVVFISALICSAIPFVYSDKFPLSIIHINDFHARYEPTDTSGGTCDVGEECIGGYARTVYTVKKLQEELKNTNPIYINAGDSFQGTLWYNIGRWNVTSQFLNILPADAMTLGNHEFDHGVEGVVPFLEHIKTEMLVANMDARDEPTMQGKYKNSTIIVRNNRKIGLIGVILETTYDLANTGKLIFRNESDAVREEAAKLKAQGANIIIVISHCGYDVDQIIAKNAGSEIDVIIGSHTHTFLFSGDNLPGPDKPRGPYPTEVIHDSGHRVLIVQASAYAKYVGNITVYFDDDGNVVDFEGAPIYMGKNVPQDQKVLKEVQAWQTEMDKIEKTVIGQAAKRLSIEKCPKQECGLGNVIADALYFKVQKIVPNINAALLVHLEMKASINKGPITMQDIFGVSPYNESLIAFQLEGHRLLSVLEACASSLVPDSKPPVFPLLQLSGVKVFYNLTAEQNHRVHQVLLRKSNYSEGMDEKYEALDLKKKYWITISRYGFLGGHGIDTFWKFGENVKQYSGDFNALLDYITEKGLIQNKIEGRINFI